MAIKMKYFLPGAHKTRNRRFSTQNVQGGDSIALKCAGGDDGGDDGGDVLVLGGFVTWSLFVLDVDCYYLKTL